MSCLDNDPEAGGFIGEAGSPLAMVGGAYEAASRHARELLAWRPSAGSADDDILYDKDILDRRSRDSVRNDAYMRSGADIRKDNIVGAMYLLNARPAYEVLGLDEVWAEEFQTEVEAKFTLWAESADKWVDVSRKTSFTEFVRLGVGLDMMAGEVLSVADWITDDPFCPFKTAVQMIDTDRLSNPPTLRDSREVRGGVRRNRRGEAIGYYIRKAHPGDWTDMGAHAWKYVPVKKPWGRRQVIHLFEQFRPEQSRGVSAMVAGLEETRIGKQFRRVMLQNAVVNATYAASIESDLPTQEVFTALGAGRGEDDLGKLVGRYAGGFLGALAAYEVNAKNATLNGVRIPHLFPGTRLQLRPAGQGGPLGTDFERSILRYLAANLGVSYEQLSRDYSQINYSSLKGALNETYKGMQARKRGTADTLATYIFLLWLEEAIAGGQITSMPRNAPNFWNGMNREAYGQCEWIGASRGQIDELKETQAAVLRLKSGLSTREDELARLGKDWRRVFAQLEREKKEASRRGLQFNDSDNMMNAASGSPREREDGEKTADA